MLAQWAILKISILPKMMDQISLLLLTWTRIQILHQNIVHQYWKRIWPSFVQWIALKSTNKIWKFLFILFENIEATQLFTSFARISSLHWRDFKNSTNSAPTPFITGIKFFNWNQTKEIEILSKWLHEFQNICSLCWMNILVWPIYVPLSIRRHE